MEAEILLAKTKLFVRANFRLVIEKVIKSE